MSSPPMYHMDGEDSEGSPSHFQMDGDDSEVDDDSAAVIARQLAELEAERPYVDDFVPEHDMPDIYRPRPSQASVVDA